MDKQLSGQSAIGILLLRMFISLRLIYGVIDNVISWERLLAFANFLQAQGLPFPKLAALTSVYLQLVAGIMILLGYKIRLASLVMVLNFLVALWVHLKMVDTVEEMTPALAMLFGALCLLFTGAERISLDSWLDKRKV